MDPIRHNHCSGLRATPHQLGMALVSLWAVYTEARSDPTTLAPPPAEHLHGEASQHRKYSLWYNLYSISNYLLYIIDTLSHCSSLCSHNHVCVTMIIEHFTMVHAYTSWDLSGTRPYDHSQYSTCTLLQTGGDVDGIDSQSRDVLTMAWDEGTSRNHFSKI